MASPRHRAPVFALVMVCLAAGTGWAGPQQPPAVGTAGAAAHRPRRSLGPSPIRLSAPDTSVALLSLVPAEIAVPCIYTGRGRLTFTLLAGPAGMTADAEIGTVRWTPPAAAEGTEPAVRVRAGDGESSAEVAFTVRVATIQPVGKSLVGSTLTVTQAGTLNGLAFTFPAQTSVPPAQVTIATVSAGQAPPLPPDVTRVSDFFRVSPVQGTTDMITVTLPTTGLPPGRKPEELRLFVFLDGVTDSLGNPERPAWVATWWGLDVLPSGKVTTRLQQLGRLSFVGLEPPVAPSFSPQGPIVTRVEVGATAITTVCTSLLLANFTVDLTRAFCTVDYAAGKSFSVIIKNSGALKTTPASSTEDLAGWLAAAKQRFDAYGLKTDPLFEVSVDGSTDNGCVRAAENRSVLHITNQPIARQLARVIAAHEFLHHAQSRTTEAGKAPIIDQGVTGKWISEGTARWFDDEFDDSFDSYRMTEFKPLEPILESGLAAAHVAGKPDGRRAYARFAFFKMLSSRCTGFSIAHLLNIDLARDPRGVANLKSRVESPGWQCDFGTGFGEGNRSSLAAALLYYAWGTQKEDDLALFDSNEAYNAFARPTAKLQPGTECTSWTSCPPASLASATVALAGARSALVAAVPGLSPGQSVTLTIESVPLGKELWVWAGDNEVPGGLSSGSWYRSTGTIKHTYGGGNRAPETIVFVVNPDPAQVIDYRIRASIANTFSVFSLAPTWAAGAPDHDFTLQALNLQPWPASYKVVWTFGHGSGDVTVSNAQTVTHRWPAVGDYPVTATLYSLPDNTVRAYAAATARIRLFGGRFTMSQFAGSASGCFWTSNKYPNAYASIAASPPTGALDLDLTGADGTVPEEAVLRASGTGDILLLANDDPANTAPLCRHAMEIAGSSYLARFAVSGDYCNGWPSTCIEVRASQQGDRIGGTISHIDTVCKQAGSSWVVHCQGTATYTFTGAWTGP